MATSCFQQEHDMEDRKVFFDMAKGQSVSRLTVLSAAPAPEPPALTPRDTWETSDGQMNSPRPVRDGH